MTSSRLSAPLTRLARASAAASALLRAACSDLDTDGDQDTQCLSVRPNRWRSRFPMSSTENPLLTAHRFFRQGPVSAEGWSQLVSKGREWESFYRDRWQHDKVVRSTHGVNCTGSCSWNVYVKEGIITWESQAVDYPSTGPDMPDHEPRGCPRGASFSWYTYSPLRVKYPYVRGSLLEMYRRAGGGGG